MLAALPDMAALPGRLAALPDLTNAPELEDATKCALLPHLGF